MHKMCVVFANAPRHMIMANVYFEYLKKNNIPYDSIHINKYGVVENTGAETEYAIPFDVTGMIGKVKGYHSFYKEAKQILINNKYSFVIVWGELTAALLSDVLKKHYRGQYCINVRDLFVGKRKILNIPLNSAITKARFVTVSSEKYLEGLTQNYKNYIFVHSYNEKIMDETNSALRIDQPDKKSEAIRILFLGNIRFYDHLERFIGYIQNDPRYQMTVAGTASDPIKDFVEKNGITNVDVYGAFPKEKTASYLGNADVIYNLYGTEDVNLRYALSNKLYYAVALNLPILVYKNTYMFEVSSRCGIGFPVDDHFDGSFADDFYNWYMHRDKQAIKMKCSELIESAIQSQKKLEEELNHIRTSL